MHKVFDEDEDEDVRLIDEVYDKGVLRFLGEFEWYVEAFKNQKVKGIPSI